MRRPGGDQAVIGAVAVACVGATLIAGPTEASRKAALNASEQRAAVRLFERLLVVIVITGSFGILKLGAASLAACLPLSQGPCQFPKTAANRDFFAVHHELATHDMRTIGKNSQ
jgi:hypothetical protein